MAFLQRWSPFPPGLLVALTDGSACANAGAESFGRAASQRKHRDLRVTQVLHSHSAGAAPASGTLTYTCQNLATHLEAECSLNTRAALDNTSRGMGHRFGFLHTTKLVQHVDTHTQEALKRWEWLFLRAQYHCSKHRRCNKNLYRTSLVQACIFMWVYKYIYTNVH